MSTSPFNNSWHTIEDVLKSLDSVSRINQQQTNLEIQNHTQLGKQEAYKPNPFPDSTYNVNSYGEFDSHELPYSAGRGHIIRRLQMQYSQSEKDLGLHSDLRKVLGPGFSNDLIEHHWRDSTASAYSDKQFEDAIYNGKQEAKHEENIDDDVNFSLKIIENSASDKNLTDSEELESERMDSGHAENIAECSSSPIVRSPKPLFSTKRRRCRNAVLLNLASKSNTNEPSDQLMMPNDFLRTSEFSGNSNHCSTSIVADSFWPQESIFLPSEFPSLKK